jgi:hypothetical protein
MVFLLSIGEFNNLDAVINDVGEKLKEEQLIQDLKNNDL